MSSLFCVVYSAMLGECCELFVRVLPMAVASTGRIGIATDIPPRPVGANDT
jgi:hypothetical protein